MLKKQWLLAALATMALAMSSPAALAKKHRISAEEAAFIANSVVQGRVVDVDYERRDGRGYYEVEIRKGGRNYEVYVDAKTGRIIDRYNNDDIEVYPDDNGDVYPHTDDNVRVYPDSNYDPHGYYGYHGKHKHGDGYYRASQRDDEHEDDDCHRAG